VSGRYVQHRAIIPDSLEHASKRSSTVGLCGLRCATNARDQF
jgi:hypothetical protein